VSFYRSTRCPLAGVPVVFSVCGVCKRSSKSVRSFHLRMGDCRRCFAGRRQPSACGGPRPRLLRQDGCLPADTGASTGWSCSSREGASAGGGSAFELGDPGAENLQRQGILENASGLEKLPERNRSPSLSQVGAVQFVGMLLLCCGASTCSDDFGGSWVTRSRSAVWRAPLSGNKKELREWFLALRQNSKLFAFPRMVGLKESTALPRNLPGCP
jgi:hypothetical protein